MSADSPEQTVLNDDGAVSVPHSVREQLGLDPGDSLEWSVRDDGTIAVEPVTERYGAFDDFEPVDMGETHAAVEHDGAGAER